MFKYDKVDAQKVFGWQISLHGVVNLVESMNNVTESGIDAVMANYQAKHMLSTEKFENVKYQAKETN